MGRCRGRNESKGNTLTRTWGICISGFTQSEATENGVLDLAEKLCRFRSPETSVRYQRWCDDFAAVAEHIFAVTRNLRRESGDESFRPTILIFAYSYGGGYGAVKLVSELCKRGLLVNAVVLSDPVWRLRLPLLGRFGRWIEALASPIALTIIGKVKFKAQSIGSIDWFFQRQNRPCGREPICAGARILRGVQLQAVHAYMDDAPEFHAKCFEVAEKFCGGAN